jgi:ubiquinone/menaquinone biosynthesis C-methylase UbiE
VFDPLNNQFKQQVRASFDATPPDYGTHGDFHWQFADRLVAHTPLQPGHIVLDVATGTAPAALIAAARVSSNGYVVGLDFSSGILTHARRNIIAAGARNFTLVCGDAEAIPLCDSCMDVILCSSAIVWLPDIPRALGNWYRVLRPGGWVAFSCFGGPARQAIIALLSGLLKKIGQVLPELNAPLNTPAKCRQMLLDAGYRNIAVHTGHDNQLPQTAEESFEWAWAGRARFNINVTPSELQTLKALYRIAFAELALEQPEWNHDYEQYVVAQR